MALSARLTNLADRISEANSGKAGNKRASRPAPQRPPVDRDDRIWPQLPELPARAEAKPQPYPRDMTGQNFSIDDLATPPTAHADELRRACDQIDHLVATINALRQEADRRDLDLATATQKQIQAENENSDLKAMLAGERKKVTALSQRLIESETAFNDRLVEVTIHREAAEHLNDELIQTKAEAPKALAAAEVRAHRLFADQIARLTERHEQQIQELRSALEERKQDNVRLERTHAELGVLFCTLTDKIAGLEIDKDLAAETIGSQADQIEFLKRAVVIERQNAEATIKELAAEFSREHAQLLARENAAAEIRKNIVQLLPRLIARQGTAAAQAAQVA